MKLARSHWIALAAAAALLALSVAVRTVLRDEGQYVAAVALMRTGLPYRDFAYLQTPLQPLLLAPLAALPAGWLLVALRIVNALLAWSTLLLVAKASRAVAPGWAITVAIAALVCTDPFLFAASLARNDALPMALLAGAVALLMRAIGSGRTRGRDYFLSGLLLGLATSAKISFALPAAGAGLFLLLTGRSRHWVSLSFFVLGGLGGLVPSIAMAALEPQRFFFGVFTYSLTAPQQWWVATGHAATLTPLVKLGQLAKIAAWGAILPALLLALADRRRDAACLLLDLMILGALIGAYLPDPAFDQYLVPLLPPLFVRLAIALGHVRKPWRAAAIALIVAGSMFGLTRTGKYLQRTLTTTGWRLGAAVEQGRMVARLARGGAVVTISPERVAGSDVNLDRGFATGPFLFRTHGALAEQAWRLGYSPNWQRLADYLDRHPPAAILTGGEPKPRLPVHPLGLDWYLDQWARSRGYRAVRAPGQGFTLYVRNPAVLPRR